MCVINTISGVENLPRCDPHPFVLAYTTPSTLLHVLEYEAFVTKPAKIG